MNRIYRVIWNCTLQVFQACSELTRRAGKTSTVNLRKSSGLTTKFSRLTLGVLLALSGSASGASLEVDNDQITNIDTDVAYDAYLVGWYGTGVLNILAGGNASLTTIMNRPGFPGECFICELRLPDHRFRWKHNKLFLLLPEEYGPAFPAIVDCYTSPPT